MMSNLPPWLSARGQATHRPQETVLGRHVRLGPVDHGRPFQDPERETRRRHYDEEATQVWATGGESGNSRR